LRGRAVCGGGRRGAVGGGSVPDGPRRARSGPRCPRGRRRRRAAPGAAAGARMKKAEFAFPGPLRDKLVAAILRGEKTSTTGLVAEYEKYGEELPVVGERELMIDSASAGVAVLETTEVRVIPLSEVDLQHALDE